MSYFQEWVCSARIVIEISMEPKDYMGKKDYEQHINWSKIDLGPDPREH